MTTTDKLTGSEIKKFLYVLIVLAALFVIAYFYGRCSRDSDAEKEIKVTQGKTEINANKAKSDTLIKEVVKVSQETRTAGQDAVNKKNELIKQRNEKRFTIPRDTAYDAQWSEVFGTAPAY